MSSTTFTSHIKLMITSVVIVFSSVFWTYEMVYDNTQLPDVEVGFPIGFVSVNYLGEDNVNSVIFKLPAKFGLYGNRDDYYERDIIWWKFICDIIIVYGIIFVGLKFLSK